MNIFLIILIVSFPAFSSDRDCVQESVNFRLGYSLTDLMISHMENLEHEDKSPEDICKVDSEELWRNVVKEMDKPHKEMLLELKTKGTLSTGRYFHSEESGKLGPEVNNQHICEIVDNQIKLNVNQYRSREYMEKFVKADLSGPSYGKLCLEFLPIVRQRILDRR